MSTITASPMLKALDLLKSNPERMTQEELTELMEMAINTMQGLEKYMQWITNRNSAEFEHAQLRAYKLGLLLARVKTAMQAAHAAQAMVSLAQPIQPENAPTMGPPSKRRKRVISQLPGSADNAASAPLKPLGAEPIAQHLRASRGGEAKEASPHLNAQH